MKRDLEIEQAEPTHRTSTLTKRLAHTPSADAPAPRAPKPRPKPAPARRTEPDAGAAPTRDRADGAGNRAPQPDGGERPDDVRPAPDIAENEGVAQVPTPKRPQKPRSRNRRHGRRR
jgi:hypothetical protein